MNDLFMLSKGQFNRIKPYFPLSHGVWVDDLCVVSGIIYVIRNGLQWKDAPHGYGPPKTLYNRFENLYKQRHKIGNMFGRLMDWRRIVMRYDRCVHTI